VEMAASLILIVIALLVITLVIRTVQSNMGR
jgi:hypothetical protein